MSTYFITKDQALDYQFQCMESTKYNCDCGNRYAFYEENVSDGSINKDLFVACNSCYLKFKNDRYIDLNIDFEINCIEKFLNNHDDAFIHITYRKIDSNHGEHVYFGTHEVNGNTEYVDLFIISDENKILSDKMDLIFELTRL